MDLKDISNLVTRPQHPLIQSHSHRQILEDISGLPPPTIRTLRDKGNTIECSVLEEDIDERIGKSNIITCKCLEALRHSSALRLLQYAIEGCAADCGDTWTWDHVEVADHTHQSRYWTLERNCGEIQ